MTIAKFQGGYAVTMSSREIAELTGKRHDNVMADIRSMLSELKIDVLTFQEISLSGIIHALPWQGANSRNRDLTCVLAVVATVLPTPRKW